jgi:hypothetical protein
LVNVPEDAATLGPFPWGIETAREAAAQIDYYALIGEAVGRLTKNTTELRRALYASAEAALLRELRALDPPISEPEIAHEHLSFHKAVHRLETEWTLQEILPVKATKLERDHPSLEQTASAPEVSTLKPESSSKENGPSETPLGSDPDPPLAPLPSLLVKATDPKPPASSIKAVIWASVTVLTIGGLAFTVYSQRERITAFLVQTGVTQVVRDITSLPSRKSETDHTSMVAAAQQAVLYEEGPTDSQVKSYVGSVIWKTERVPEGEGQTAELAIRGSVEIPEVDMHLTMRLRRNTEKALSATHTIEMIFNSGNSTFSGISAMPGMLMKGTEQAVGERLAGITINRTSGFFVIGLSATEIDKRRNLQLMKEQSWFDIPIIYGNGRRAILAFEKGVPGEVAFKEAFAEWAE